MKGIIGIERLTMIKCMEFIARQVNDEVVLESWLMDGVADGDIEYGEVGIRVGDFEKFDYYMEDEHFADLMNSFLYTMKEARKSGGLYCDGVVSK